MNKMKPVAYRVLVFKNKNSFAFPVGVEQDSPSIKQSVFKLKKKKSKFLIEKYLNPENLYDKLFPHLWKICKPVFSQHIISIE